MMERTGGERVEVLVADTGYSNPASMMAARSTLNQRWESRAAASPTGFSPRSRRPQDGSR